MASFNLNLYKNTKPGANPDRPQSIYLSVYTDRNERIRLRTPIKVKPAHWSSEKQRVRHAGNAMDLNHDLKVIIDKSWEIYKKHKDKSADFLKEKLKKGLFSQNEEKSFIDFYNQFKEERAKTHAPRTIMKYNSLKLALENFASKRKFKLAFEALDATFYDKFTDYLRTKERPLLDDTIAKYVSNLKTFMDWAFERGHHKTTEYRKFKARRLPKVEIVTLNEDEVKAIEIHEPGSDKLKRVKDLFLFLIYTGQRVSDLITFDKSQIIDDRWVLEAEKTKKKKKIIVVPFKGWCAPALEILKKYDYQLPVISEQKLNDYIKELGKDVVYNEKKGLTRQVSKRRFRGSEEIITTGPLHDFMSSHMARRTCITVLIKKGMPLPILQKLTGHSDVKTLMKYENTSADDLEKALIGMM